MSIGAQELQALLLAWMWPFFRIGAMLAAAPIFGNRMVPTKIRLGLALLLTMVIAPVLPEAPVPTAFSAESLVIGVQQVLIGLAMGFALRLVFAVLELAGQLIAQLMGLGFAAMVDPQSGLQMPVVSQFYIVMATLVFLGLDGHLIMIEVLVESFRIIPIGELGLSREGMWSLVQQGSWVFASAVLMALPAIGALLVVNIAFGVMTRAAPQLNIFAVGFPITLMVGFVIMLLTLGIFVRQLDGLFLASFENVRLLLAAPF